MHIANNVLLFEYYLDFPGKQILLFVIHPDLNHPEVVKINKDPHEITSFLNKDFKTLTNTHHDLLFQEEEMVNLISSNNRFQTDLFEIVEPILKWTKQGDLIWFVPHDILHNIPLHALEFDGTSLIERNPVCYSPSASIMKFCKKGTKKTYKNALIFGDSLSDERPLPHGRMEAISIAELFQTQPIIGEEATKSRLIKELNSLNHPIDILHISCHGQFESQDDPLDSRILLAKGTHITEQSNEYDWHLTAKDIFSLEMPIDLVTLSACESGLNELNSGDELFGLVRALIYAGVSSIVVSLWKVDDFSTSILMEHFYMLLTRYHFTENGKASTKAEALQKAQIYVKNITARRLLETYNEKLLRFDDTSQQQMYYLYGRGIAQKFAGDNTQAINTFNLILSKLESLSAYWKYNLRNRINVALAEINLHNREYKIDYDFKPFSHFSFWAPFILIGDWD